MAKYEIMISKDRNIRGFFSMNKLLARIVLVFALGLITMTLSAQTAVPTNVPAPLPSSWILNVSGHEPQKWNNCGPATMTNALRYFGYADNQDRAAQFLKPNYEDKNVSPWQMLEFVNNNVPELNVFAMKRYGGTLDRLKTLIANNFPVIIEAGYDPEPERLGWMGHYLFVKGYDDGRQEFTTSDSYLGDNYRYSYDHIQEFWQHFNYVYIVLYPSDREQELMGLLGTDADERQNVINALEIARVDATANLRDAFAWFNMGSNFVMLGMYNEAATAYDEARKIGLPFRMLWYQFGMYEAYYNVGRYDDMVTLAQQNLNDGGGQYVEETYYYGGLARLGKGETQRARENFTAALQFNPNFTPAQLALNELPQT
jgi:hypothetical protein